jgi:aerobic-type carbon monoxide dehydrogenase small subunit (CoxS/CutS family)
MLVKVAINGEKHEADVEPRLLLVHLIRETLRLTGTHIGCDTTHCGACTEDEIRWAISGNLCRCTGYVNIVKAIQHAAATMQGGA